MRYVGKNGSGTIVEYGKPKQKGGAEYYTGTSSTRENLPTPLGVHVGLVRDSSPGRTVVTAEALDNMV